MKGLIALALVAGCGQAASAGLMEDCEPDRGSLQCIHRNGVCVEVAIDGHATQPISREQRERIMDLPGMDDVCWQVAAPVSAAFRVQARGGGLQPGFVGPVENLGVLVVPIEDYDPEFDGNRIDPLHEFGVDADGYRDGTWQLKRRAYLATGSDGLAAAEYVVVIRVHGRDNWDKQEVLLRIDPTLPPAPPQMGSAGASPGD